MTYRPHQAKGHLLQECPAPRERGLPSIKTNEKNFKFFFVSHDTRAGIKGRKKKPKK
jgi:hypothetical protein